MPTGLKTNVPVKKGKRGSNIWIIYYRVSGLSHIFRITEFELQKGYIVTCILCLFGLKMLTSIWLFLKQSQQERNQLREVFYVNDFRKI